MNKNDSATISNMYGSSGKKRCAVVCNYDSEGYAYAKLNTRYNDSTEVIPVKCTHADNGNYIRPNSTSTLIIIRY